MEISSFYKSVPKIMFICYTVPEIWHKMGVIVIFHFGLYAGKSKLKKKKNENNAWRYHHFRQVYHK